MSNRWKVRNAEKIAVAVIILLASALSAIWVLRVPPFMVPDEVAHADYAFSFFDAGGPYRLRSSRPGSYVEPQTRYLIAAAKYRRLRYDSAAVATTNFSDRVERARIDRGAPAPRGRPPGDRATVPYEMNAYPPLYFWAMAAVMRAAWGFTNHSLVAAFYAARFTNIAYLVATLLAMYGILFETLRSATNRLLLFFAVALFPMTSWIAAYIQPDNQSALFVSLAVYLGLRLRRLGDRTSRLVVLGIVECALACTKFHYAMIVAVSLLLSLRGTYGTLASRRKALFVVCVGGAPFLAIFLGVRTLPSGSFLSAPPPPDNLTIGSSAYLHLTATKIATEIGDAFVDGSIFRSFWLKIGIRGGSTFENLPSFQLALESLVLVGTLVTIVAISYRQCSVLVRMIRVAKHRGLRSFATFVASDIHANTYLLLTVFLFVASALGNGYLAIQGRYWYPVLISLFAFVVINIERANRGKRRRIVATVACAALASLSLVLTPGALLAMEREYYGPGRTSAPGYELGGIDRITVDGKRWPDRELAVAAGSPIFFHGFAIDGERGIGARDVRFHVDDAGFERAVTGRSSRDLALNFQDPILSDAGFELRIATDRLRVGKHRLEIIAIEKRAPRGLIIAVTNFSIGAPARPTARVSQAALR